jgi:hypothetical protein
MKKKTQLEIYGHCSAVPFNKPLQTWLQCGNAGKHNGLCKRHFKLLKSDIGNLNLVMDLNGNRPEKLCRKGLMKNAGAGRHSKRGKMINTAHKTAEDLCKEFSTDFTQIKEVMGVNFKSHPYVIGPAHVTHCDGILSNATIRSMERNKQAHCLHGNWQHPCHLPFEQHTCGHVAFIELRRNVGNKELWDIVLFMI